MSDIVIKNLRKSFGRNEVLHGIDLTFPAGEFIGLMGPNGAGKSTLIKILGGVYARSSGEIAYGGRPVNSLADLPEVGFIHQDLGLIDDLTSSTTCGSASSRCCASAGSSTGAVSATRRGSRWRASTSTATPTRSWPISPRRRRRSSRSRVPSREELVERYGELTGRSVADVRWYQVFSLWKSAIFLEGSYGRLLTGTTDDPFFRGLERGVPELIERAWEIATQPA